MMYSVWLGSSLIVAYFVTRFAANRFGPGAGIGAFLAVVILSAVAASSLNIELSGAGCPGYGIRADC